MASDNFIVKTSQHDIPHVIYSKTNVKNYLNEQYFQNRKKNTVKNILFPTVVD